MFSLNYPERGAYQCEDGFKVETATEGDRGMDLYDVVFPAAAVPAEVAEPATKIPEALEELVTKST